MRQPYVQTDEVVLHVSCAVLYNFHILFINYGAVFSKEFTVMRGSVSCFCVDAR